MQIFNIHFLNPEYFLLLIFLPIFIYFLIKKNKKNPIFSGFDDLKKIFKINSYFYYLKIFLIILIFLVFSFLLANPNFENISEKEKKNWVDIILALDISDSMNAEDLQPNRLESAKKLISKFLEKQKTNRVWLVVFSWKPFISIPLTFDYLVLQESIKNIDSWSINQTILWWTAIWDAILTSKNMFDKEQKQREKIIILLTDWEANIWIDPKIASLSAKEENVKIYSIWIWWEKEAYVKVQVWGFIQKYPIPPLNDEFLKEISAETKGKFFRATDNETFENIFEELEKLQKTDLEEEVSKSYKDFYDFFAYILIFLLFSFLLIFLDFRKK